MGLIPPASGNPGSAVSEGAQNFLQNLQSRIIPALPGSRPNIVKGISNGLVDFVFDYAGEVQARHDADITDHFTELNAVVNDHMAIRPVRVTLHGFVAELAQTKTAAEGIFSPLQSALTTVPVYLGKYTPGAAQTLSTALTQAQNVEAQINSAIGQGKRLANLFKNSATAQTQQQQAYAELVALQENRQLCDVATPYTLYKNMVIESVVFTQDAETRMWSDISVTMKQLRFAVVLADVDVNAKFDGRAALQNTPAKNQGITPAVNQNPSMLSGLLGVGQ